ncbi:MAG: hypothetical protein EA402_03220 [Planctomycetota bacterium]|nr:MAG: hypothetical protein EA402_03220 [Planctomycetota bacterium]
MPFSVCPQGGAPLAARALLLALVLLAAFFVLLTRQQWLPSPAVAVYRVLPVDAAVPQAVALPAALLNDADQAQLLWLVDTAGQPQQAMVRVLAAAPAPEWRLVSGLRSGDLVLADQQQRPSAARRWRPMVIESGMEAAP